ncbi:MAG: SDR family oxidoreductase [Myxococcota bacterium]
MLDFREKHIVVVGGSSGIGRSVVELARNLGAAVTFTGRDPEKTSVVEEATGASAKILDIQDELAVSACFDDLASVDHVYVAAGATKLGSILDGQSSEHFSPIDLRLRGSVFVVRAAAPRMAEGGSFVFTGGLSTDRPVSGAWVSGVATAAAEQLARVLALDLAPLRFNAVSPGYTDTPMWDVVFGDAKDEVLTGAGQATPLGRVARPEEVALAVLFLMANSAVTGEIVHVDGGGRLS